MLENAIRRALTQLAKIFSTRYGTGKEIGKALSSLVIIAPATYMVKKKMRQVQMSKVQDIHYSTEDNELNTDGRGRLVGAIYEDEDGEFHKLTNDGWLSWNGSQWV